MSRLDGPYNSLRPDWNPLRRDHIHFHFHYCRPTGRRRLHGRRRHHWRHEPHERVVGGHITIDPDTGALHEGMHDLWLGPPKTPASVRTITLPPFLAVLLHDYLTDRATIDSEFVFTTRSGTWLRRSTFDRRVLRPAADGNIHRDNPRARTVPACPGLTFHGLRHSHKTWLIADRIPEIAQARRLGHRLTNRVVECYSHIAPEIETELLQTLEHRWKILPRHTRIAAVTPTSTPCRTPATTSET